MTIREILWPTDLSECADLALPHAAAWCRRHGARLHALHVATFDEDNPLEPAHYAERPRAMWREVQELVEESIHESLRRAGALDLDVQTSFVLGDPSREIAARAASADLVAMGTHGRTGFRSLLLGSVTERLIRESPRPVLAVRRMEPVEPPVLPSRILVPIDFSGAAVAAIRQARELAGRSRASIVLMHVVEDVIAPDFYFPAGPVWLDVTELKESADHRLREAFEAAGGPAVPVEYRVLSGRAALDIARFAEEKGVDLIVLPTHGLGGVERLLLGSTAEKIIRRAPCPVLILPLSWLAADAAGHAPLPPGAVVSATAGEP